MFSAKVEFAEEDNFFANRFSFLKPVVKKSWNLEKLSLHIVKLLKLTYVIKRVLVFSISNFFINKNYQYQWPDQQSSAEFKPVFYAFLLIIFQCEFIKNLNPLCGRHTLTQHSVFWPTGLFRGAEVFVWICVWQNTLKKMQIF